MLFDNEIVVYVHGRGYPNLGPAFLLRFLAVLAIQQRSFWPKTETLV